MRKQLIVLVCIGLMCIITGCAQNGATLTKQQQSITLDIYGVNDELTDLTKREASIVYESEEELVSAVAAELQASSVENWESIWRNIAIDSINLVGQSVMIDIDMLESDRFGATGEAYLVDSLLHTFFQLEFVDEIYITANGEEVESLMGHVELLHPFIKNN